MKFDSGTSPSAVRLLNYPKLIKSISSGSLTRISILRPNYRRALCLIDPRVTNCTITPTVATSA